MESSLDDASHRQWLGAAMPLWPETVRRLFSQPGLALLQVLEAGVEKSEAIKAMVMTSKTNTLKEGVSEDSVRNLP